MVKSVAVSVFLVERINFIGSEKTKLNGPDLSVICKVNLAYTKKSGFPPLRIDPWSVYIW